MSVDSIGDFLTIIRNGLMLGKRSVVAPHSKLKFQLAEILKAEGFINDVVLVDEDIVQKKVKVYLKYVNGESVIHEIFRKSTPGRRYYSKAKALKPVKGKLGISILSTNKGLLTDKAAKDMLVGGELLCSVW